VRRAAAALAALVLLASCSDDPAKPTPTPKPPPSTMPTAAAVFHASDAPQGSSGSLVATVDGEKLTERDVQIAVEELAPGGAAALDEQKREQIIGFLINVKLVAKAAEKAKLGEGAEFETRLKFLRDKALMQAYLEKLGKEGVTEDAVKKVYGDTIKEIKPEQEVHARHILVET